MRTSWGAGRHLRREGDALLTTAHDTQVLDRRRRRRSLPAAGAGGGEPAWRHAGDGCESRLRWGHGSYPEELCCGFSSTNSVSIDTTYTMWGVKSQLRF